MAKTSISGFFQQAGEFVQQVKAEARKIVWPTSKETVMTAVFVLLLTTILALFFFTIDSAFGWIVKQLLSLVSQRS